MRPRTLGLAVALVLLATPGAVRAQETPPPDEGGEGTPGDAAASGADASALSGGDVGEGPSADAAAPGDDAPDSTGDGAGEASEDAPTDDEEVASPYDLSFVLSDDGAADEAYDPHGDLPVLPVLGPTTLSFTNTTVVEYWNDNFNSNEAARRPGGRWREAEADDGFLGLTERLQLVLQGDEVRLSARVDGFAATQAYGGWDLHDNNPDDTFAVHRAAIWDLRLERLTATFQRGPWTVHLGDAPATVGRGIALTLRKEDILGLDVTNRGAQVQYDDGSLYWKVLGGVPNTQNLDPQALVVFGDRSNILGRLYPPGYRPDRSEFETGRRDDLQTEPVGSTIVGAAEVGYRFGEYGDYDVGVHGTGTDFSWVGAGNLTRDDAQLGIIGGHFAAPSLFDGRMNLYVEYNQMWRNDRVFTLPTQEISNDRRCRPGSDRGDHACYALYASLNVQATDELSILFEWKDYRDFINAVRPNTDYNEMLPQWAQGAFEAPFQFSVPPAFERDAERPRASYNARGGRVRLDYRVPESDWSLAGAFLGYGHAEDVERDPWDGILVTHGYAELQKVNTETDPNVPGWTMDIVLGYRQETWLHSDDRFGDLAQPGELDWRVIHGNVDASVVFGDNSLELRVDQRFERRLEGRLKDFVRGEVTVTWSWKGVFRMSPALRWNDEISTAPSLYPALEMRWDYTPGSFFSFLVGRTPGGIICANGVCREVPPFEGAKLTWVARL